MMYRHLLRSTPLLLLALAVSAPLAEAEGNYYLSKNQRFRQTGTNTVVPDPILPFEFEVNGSVNITLTLPSGLRAPIALSYNKEDDDEEFIFRKMFPTKAAMDTAFPAGIYRIAGTGIPNLALNLPELYPANTPQVTSVTNGTWNAGGLLVVNPTQPITFNLSSFSDYGAGGASYMSAGVWGYTEQDDIFGTEIANVGGFDIPVQTTPFTSFTIAAGRMVNGRYYEVEVEFSRIPTADLTAVPNGSVVSVGSKSLRFFMYAQTGTATPAIPTITTTPGSRTVATGASTTFTAAVTIPGTAQSSSIARWFKDGFEIDTTSPRFVYTGPTLRINEANLTDTGDYVVEFVGPGGVVRTTPATLTVPVFPAVARLTNLSVTTTLGVGDEVTLGYVVGGAGTSGTKPVIIRAAGPSLAALNVAGGIDDPKLELFAGSGKTLENDNWGGAPSLVTDMAAVGAFGFSSATSRDAALKTDIAAGENSVLVTPVGNSTGLVTAEVYDTTPSLNMTAATPRLINVSVRKHLGDVLTIGFVIDGSSTKTVFVRAVGPTLGGVPFGIPGVVADPQLSLFGGSRKIGENNDWGGTVALTSAFAQVAAFPLPAGSKDAALLATLPPGQYSVQVSGVGNTTGVAIVEVYELP
jgi:hypothetical protein